MAENLPPNSSIRFGILLALPNTPPPNGATANTNSWNRSSHATYVELQPGSGLHADSARCSSFATNTTPILQKTAQQGPMERPRRTCSVSPATACRHTHRTGGIRWQGAAAINPKYGWILLGLGGLVLLIACINFHNTGHRPLGRARARDRGA
ncbi:MAG: hypothetical protein IPK76_01355 [Lewinellaceae bacterium]|nr:hypothetical protein [Lewinellaceae bacterium]